MRFLSILSVVLLFGCNDVGEQTLQVKAAGLWLTANPLDAPPGALAVADNAVIRRPGIVEPRRGQAPDTELPQNVDAMAAFEGNVIAHGATGSIYTRTAENTFTTLAGTFTPPDGHPMRFAEAGGGLYFTTDEGPQRMDTPLTNPTPAGIPPGLEGSGTTTGSTGWLADGRVVGYRLVWGARDGDGALMLGAPSGRILVTNSSGGTRDVAITSPIPDGIAVDTHFLQIYRTVIDVASGDDPGEDMAQVLEVFPTPTDLSNGTITVTDIASFANGATAYFSPSSGAGLADAKAQPGLLTDGIAFKGYLFGVVQAYRQTVQISLIGVGGTDGLLNNEGLLFIDNADLVTYPPVRFLASDVFAEGTSAGSGAWWFTRATGGTAAQNIENTARSLVRVINLRADWLTATYVSSPNDLPGMLIVERVSVDPSPVTVRAVANTKAWTPAFRSGFVADLTRVSNVVTGTTGIPHHLAVNDRIEQLTTIDPNFPAGTFTVLSVPTSTTFTYASVGVDASVLAQTFNLDIPDFEMNQEAVPGSWAHSAFQEPDAWPPRFRYQVGGPNTRLDRITAQGEALLFWTSDGLYRLTGNDENDFTLRPVDPTIILVGTSTPATMGNKAFALTSQGVVSVTDLGVEKVSTPIDQAILPFYASTDAYREVTDEVAFGVAYSSENEYYLFLPTSDGPAPGDPAVQAYVFNVQTGTWVRHTWEWAGINEDTGAIAAAVVNPTDNYLYLGSADWITRERKSRGLTDYQDTLSAGIPLDVAYVVETAKNPGAFKQWTEVACLLEAPQPSAVELYFTTEIATVEEGGTISSQGNKAVRTYIPRNMSRSARLTVGLRHSTAQEKPTILGLSVVYNTTSTRVGR